VELQLELFNGSQRAVDFLEPHCAFFTFGENYGKADCRLPVAERFRFRPTRQPVLLDFWQPESNGANPCFTTIGNWRQAYREIPFQGEIYHWSKHFEFLKFLDLPKRTPQPLELALGQCIDEDKQMLKSNGWRVRPAFPWHSQVDEYRDYIRQSRGEFTVAKDQNIRLRSGWFSDRSVTYLAAGRPVINQETGFSNVLPTGKGLFAFTTMDDIIAFLETINSDYESHRRAAVNLARDYFNYDVVLKPLLAEVGL